MNEHENFSTGTEARRSMASRPWSPSEGNRQDTLVRYLGAVVTAAAEHARPEKQPPPAPVDAPREPATGSGTPLVRDVMEVPAAWLRDDLPYREIARQLAREHVGALPVVDAEDRVVGVVSESDLLAKVAVEASGHRPGPVGRLRGRRLLDKAQGETAADLMTSPAITVLPGATVAEAAWLAALSRLKRIPVTDHEGRLVGAVGRDALLRTLIRDDAGIQAEVEDRIRTVCAPGDRTTVQVTVHDGIVELTGQLPAATGDRLVAETEGMADVVEVKNLLTVD
ncbi:CBS domain-containing protein [Streptomyces sp. 900105755]